MIFTMIAGSRSSRPEVFCKKFVLKNFTKIHRKTPVPESFFNKIAGLKPATLLKKRLWHRCFPVNFVKYLITPITYYRTPPVTASVDIKAGTGIKKDQEFSEAATKGVL